MAQMKEQIKTLEKQPNKREIRNLSEAEDKTLVIRMLKELSEDLNSIKKIQSEMKNTIIEMKNNLQVKHSIVVLAENQINDLEHKEAKSNQNNKKKKQSKKNEDSISNLWDNFKHSNISNIRVLEEEKA